MSKLVRKPQIMSKLVYTALIYNGVLKDYKSRPAYQQSDCLMWINKAKTDSTKAKRTQQMIDELKIGGLYMNMTHKPSIKK